MWDNWDRAGGRREERVARIGEDDTDVIDATRVVTTPATLEGDDIVVLPEPVTTTHVPTGRRRLTLLVGSLGATALIIALVVMATSGGHSKSNVVTSSPARRNAPAANTPASARTRERSLAKAPATNAVTAPAASTPRTKSSTPAGSPPANSSPPATPSSAPVPKQYPPSALTWSAPLSITVQHGQSTAYSVTAHNPTDGSITLPHPLSCAPTLDNSGMCSEIAQIIPAGGTVSVMYSLDANVAPGNYTLDIEGVLKIPVDVTP